MALFMVETFISKTNSDTQILGLSQKFYIKSYGFIPAGTIFVSTHDIASYINVDETNINSLKLNNYFYTFSPSNLRTVLLKKDESLEIFFKNPLKSGSNTIQSVKLTHFDSKIYQRELGIA